MTVQEWHAPAVNTSKHSSLFCQADLAYKAVIAAKVSEEYGRRRGMPHILFGIIYPGTPINHCGFGGENLVWKPNVLSLNCYYLSTLS